MNEQRTGQGEMKEKVLRIKDSKSLAANLGFVRNEDIKETWYMEYLKKLPEGKYATLAFQNGKYGGEQRIILGIKTDESSPKNEKEWYLCQNPLFDERIRQLGLTINKDSMFVRAELNDGGYLKLYQLLSELEASGLYTTLLEK